MIFVYIIAGILLGILIAWLCLKGKIQTTQQLDKRVIEENNSLRQLNSDLLQQHSNLTTKLVEANNELKIIEIKKEESAKQIKELEQWAEDAGNALYDAAVKKAEVNIELALTELTAKYTNAEEACRKAYAQVMNEGAKELQEAMSGNGNEMSKLNAQLDDLRSKMASAVEANKRAEELKTKTEFYKLQLSEVDTQEIEMLRNVAPYLRDKEPLNKVIWKCYYEKPTTDLIGRVVGSGIHCGIYKITNLENGMCYVGQAVKIGR